MDTAKASTVERRIYKRFDADLPVFVNADTGEQLKCRATNISLAGMELRTDRWAINKMLPKGEKTTPDQSPVVRMQLDIPTSEGDSRPVVVDCRVLLVRRVSEQEYYLHVQYDFFQGHGYNDLEEYADAMMVLRPDD